MELRKVILGILPNFINNQSWRFLDAKAPIANPLSPWPLDESVEVNQLDKPVSGQDFKGIKIGDVNNNAIANASATPAENRSGKQLNLMVEEMDVVKEILTNYTYL